MRIIGTIPDPAPTVTGFFDSLCAGDFQKADSYLADVSVSMKEEPVGGFQQKLYGYLLKSYRYQTVGQPETDSFDARQDVSFTYLDFDRLAGDLREQSSKLGKKYMVERNEAYAEPHGTSWELTDKGAEMVASEALDKLLSDNPEPYYTTRTFRIRLKYQDRAWHILMDNDLFDAISGQFSDNRAAD